MYKFISVFFVAMATLSSAASAFAENYHYLTNHTDDSLTAYLYICNEGEDGVDINNCDYTKPMIITLPAHSQQPIVATNDEQKRMVITEVRNQQGKKVSVWNPGNWCVMGGYDDGIFYPDEEVLTYADLDTDQIICTGSLHDAPLEPATKQTALRPMQLITSAYHDTNVPTEQIKQLIAAHLDLTPYGSIKTQVIYNPDHTPHHLLVFLPLKNTDGLDIARIDIDAHYQFLQLTKNYHLSTQDLAQRPGLSDAPTICPDPDVNLLIFIISDGKYPEERDGYVVGSQVAKVAAEHHLKTVTLGSFFATSHNLLNYLSCPNLKGTFYVGHGEKDKILTNDGYLTADDIKQKMPKLQHKVMNMWVACLAFNDPMYTAMIKDAQSQKYASGITQTSIPSNAYTGACAIKQAIMGKPITESFWACQKRVSIPRDRWGIAGDGNDYFGK